MGGGRVHSKRTAFGIASGLLSLFLRSSVRLIYGYNNAPPFLARGPQCPHSTRLLSSILRSRIVGLDRWRCRTFWYMRLGYPGKPCSSLFGAWCAVAKWITHRIHFGSQQWEYSSASFP